MSTSPFLAQYAFQGTNLYVVIFIVVLLAAMLGVLMLIFAKCYVRCPSNRVLVIFGKAGKGKLSLCLHGGARFVVPLFQDYRWLNLEPMQIEIPLRGALSMENIRVNVPSVFTVAIGTTPELMQNAAIRLLDLTSFEVKKQAEDIIFGQLRQVIASMAFEDINRDRDKFLTSIQESLEPELLKIGLVLINIHITDITDDQKATLTALLRKLLELLRNLLEDGELSDEDREEIRRLLDDSSSSP